MLKPPKTFGNMRQSRVASSLASRTSLIPYNRVIDGKAVLTQGNQSTQIGGDLSPDDVLNVQKQLVPSLAAIQRPAGATRWMLPSAAQLTPQYIDGVLRGALAGNHVQAWELFDVMIDNGPELASCIGEYVDGIAMKKRVVTPYAEEDQEPTETAVEKARLVSAAIGNMRPDMANDENDFRGTIKDLLFARFHGQSVLEIDWYKQDGSGLNVKQCPGIGESGKVLVPRSTFWVHPVCYAWDMAGRLGLRMALESQLKQALTYAPNLKFAKNIFGNLSSDRMRSMVEPPAWNWISSQARPSQLMDFPANKFLIGIDKFKAGTVMGSGSCLRVLAWWWIASMYGADFCLNYAQLFGIPFRKATCSPSTSDAKKQEIRQMLQSCGSAGYILLDAGNTVDFERAATGAGESPQAFLMHFANDQIRKVILRQTMSGGTSGGGSKGVGKSFGDTEAEGSKEQCFAAGAQFVESVINLQLIPYILNVNYGEGGDLEAPTVALTDDDVGSLPDVQRDQILCQFTDMPVSYFRRKYRFPKPGIDPDTGEKEPIAGKDEGSTSRQPAPTFGGKGGSPFGGSKPPGEGEEESDSGGDEGGDGAGDVSARYSLNAASHPFYGNQWTQEEGKAIVPLSKKITSGSEVLWKDDSGTVHHGQLRDHESGTGQSLVREVNVERSDVVKNGIPYRLRTLVPTIKGQPGEDILDEKYTIKVPTERLAQRKGSGFRQRDAAQSYPQFPTEITASAKKSPEASVTKALADTAAPLIKRFRSIDEIADPEVKAAALKKLLADLPKISKALQADPQLAEAVAVAAQTPLK